MKDQGHTKNNSIIINHALLNALIILGIYIIKNRVMESNIDMIFACKAFAMISLVLYGYYVYIWDRVTQIRFNIFSIFMGSFLLFTMGQPILFALNFVPSKVNLFARFPLVDIVKAELYTLLCFVTFFEGGLLSLIIIKPRKIHLDGDIYNNDNDLLSMQKLGIILFLIFLIPAVYSLFRNISLATSLGYKALSDSTYSGSLLAKVLIMSSEYFTVSLIILMIGFKESKLGFNIISGVAYFLIAYYFILGERATPTAIILMILWYRSNYLRKSDKKSNTKFIFQLLATTILLFAIFPIIGQIRNNGIISLSELVSEFNSESNNSKFMVESIASLGYSMFPLIHTMNLIPQAFPFKYGTTYLNALTSIIPNFFGGVHIAAQNSRLGEWLMRTLNMSYGPGFSIPAEAYYNFGWFPIPFMLVFGALFAKLLTVSKNEKTHYIRLFVAMTFFYMNITTPRREFLGVVRDVAYYIIPIAALIHIISARSRTQNIAS